MLFLKLSILLLTTSLVAEETEIEQTSNMRHMPPPNTSNSVFYKTQKEQFKDPPFRNCGKDEVYKDGRCKPAPPPMGEDGTEQTPQKDTSD